MVRNRDWRVFCLAGLTTAVAQRLGVGLDDTQSATSDFACKCCSEITAEHTDTLLQKISDISGYSLYRSDDSVPPHNLDELADRIARMAQMLADSLNVGTEIDRKDTAASYVIRNFHDLVHRGIQGSWGFAAYNRSWNGYRYKLELAEATAERLAFMVEHLTQLCRDVPDNEQMPAIFFPRNLWQREIYLGRGSERNGMPPLNSTELKDLLGILLARYRVKREMLLTDEVFLQMVTEVRARADTNNKRIQ